MKIDVLIGAYNSQNYIVECLDSVNKQSLKPQKIVIIDDCSSDSTLKSIHEYKATSIIPIHIIANKKNLGLTKSLNLGLELCTSELIARLDADDLWHEKKLEFQVNFLKKNKNIHFCCSNINFLGQLNINKQTNFILKTTDFPLTNPYNHSSLLIYKKVINSIDNYNQFYKYSQDTDLYFRLLKNGYEGEILINKLVERRISENIIGLKKRRQQLFFFWTVQIRYFFSRLKENRLRLLLSILKTILRLLIPQKLINKLKHAF